MTIMNEWRKGLTPEQKKALEACKDDEEVIAYCKEHRIALPDELLRKIAGGLGADNYSIAPRRDEGAASETREEAL